MLSYHQKIKKELIYDARKNNVAGSIGHKRAVLSSWHKAYQKRTLSIGSEIPEDNYQRAMVHQHLIPIISQ